MRCQDMYSEITLAMLTYSPPNYVVNGPSDPFPHTLTSFERMRLHMAGYRYCQVEDMWWLPTSSCAINIYTIEQALKRTLQ